MSDLEAAIAAEIEECEHEEVEVSSMTQWGEPDIVTICAIHGCDWDDDEAIPCWERRRMTAALRRMWDAAINAAVETTLRERTDRTGNYHAGGNEALSWAAEQIHALLSEGGNRD